LPNYRDFAVTYQFRVSVHGILALSTLKIFATKELKFENSKFFLFKFKKFKIPAKVWKVAVQI